MDLLLTNGLNEFGLELFRTIYTSKSELIIGMLMTLGGARNETSTELVRSLRLDKLINENPKLEQNMALLHESIYSLIRSIARLEDMDDNNVIKLGNKMLVNSIRPNEDYRRLIGEAYEADIVTIEASTCEQTVEETNKWIRELTQGRIPTIVDYDTLASTSIALINAIYFKQEWDMHFDAALTSKQEFRRLGDKSTVYVDMMQLRNVHVAYAFSASLKAHLVRLPYKNDKFAFTVVLPESDDDFLAPQNKDSLINRITYETLTNEVKNLQKEKIDLKMPRFVSQKKLKLNEILMNLGIKSAFNKTKADFTGITETDKIFIQEVLQYAFIEVNEKGTEAAAATVVRIAKRSLEIHKSIVLDRPFIYYISENASNLILFLGTFNGQDGSESTAKAEKSEL